MSFQIFLPVEWFEEKLEYASNYVSSTFRDWWQQFCSCSSAVYVYLYDSFVGIWLLKLLIIHALERNYRLQSIRYLFDGNSNQNILYCFILLRVLGLFAYWCSSKSLCHTIKFSSPEACQRRARCRYRKYIWRHPLSDMWTCMQCLPSLSSMYWLVSCKIHTRFLGVDFCIYMEKLQILRVIRDAVHLFSS